MGTMGKIRIGVVLVVLLKLVAVCLGDKDPTLSLRPPSSSSPVFSSSIDSIPVVSASSQQTIYSKRPNSVHSTVASSVSSSSNDQATSGGRNNNPWYAPGNTFSFDFNGANGGDLSSASASSHSPSSASNGGGYYEHPPGQAAAPSSPPDSYSPPSGAPGQPSYTYFYQHYPSASGSNHGWSGGGGDDGGHSGLFGDLSLPGLQLPALSGGGGLAGLGGVGGLKVLKAIAKGVLLIKPFLVLGLLLLIALPILFLLLPIPIITITSQPSMLRAARSSKIGTYLTELSGKVLNAEECLERIICKMPHAPEKYQSRVKLIWDEYGSRMVANERVSRGLKAYFETSSQKNKNLKCNERFKCSNKYL